MSLEKYQQMMEVTMTPVDYMIRLHEQFLVGCEQLERFQREGTKEERFETIQKLQLLLFECLAMTDRTDERGDRLFVAYLYYNRQLVDMRLSDTYDTLPFIKEEISSFLRGWREYRRKMRRHRGKSGRI